MPIKLDPAHIEREWRELSGRLARLHEELRRQRPVTLAASPRQAVWQDDGATLYRYLSDRPARNRTPVLIVYSLINRPSILDLRPQRSLVGALRDGGSDVYLLDWGYPTPADRFLSLDDYVNGYLDRAVREICRRHDCDEVALLGVCQGGTLALCYAALHPQRVRGVITLVTPVDFHAGESVLYRLCKHIDFDRVVDAAGNVPADVLNAIFVSLKPYRVLSQRYVDMLGLVDDPQAMTEFLRMEQWMYDSPDQAGEAFRQFAKDCYQRNALVRGELRLDDHAVDPARLTMPILNVYASADHLVPPASAAALGALAPSRDYCEIALDSGHLGVFISGRVQRAFFPALIDWLRDHD